MSSSTQVILLERVEKLGELGEVVSVKPGYARNYLLPQKKALRASKENIAYFDAQKKIIEADNEKNKKEAEKLAKKIAGAKAPIIRQASEAGQLFGSVTSRDIAQAISDATKAEVSRNMVQLNQNLKIIGLIPVDISLHPEVKVEVIINIARSMEEAEIQAETGRALIADNSSIQETKAPVEEVSEGKEDTSDEAQEDSKEAEA